MNRVLISAAIAALMLALQPGAQAGSASWANTPTQGPSPNNSHIVSGTGCENSQSDRIAPAGIALFGQPSPDPNSVTVRLFHPGPGAQIKEETFDANLDGTWSVVFEIPANLPAGVYPLSGQCNGFETSRVAPSGLAPVVLGGPPSCFNCFEYEEPRSYTVIAAIEETDPGEPVEAEVTFTG